MPVHHRPSRIVWWLRGTIVVGTLLIATGVGGMVHQARQKVAAIDCLSGASPPSHWEYDQRGSETIRSLVGERGALMFLDQPRELAFQDVFTADQANALHDLPTLRRLSISYAPVEDLRRLRGLTNLEQLRIGGEAPPEQIAELQASLPDCDIIYRYCNGSETREVRFPAR